MLAAVSVFAAGETGDEAFNLIIDNQVVQTFHDIGGDIEARDFQRYTVHTDGPVSADQVQVEFFNDQRMGDYDRNLVIDKIVVDGKAFQTEADTTFSTGFVKLNGDFTGPGFFSKELLTVNGTLSYLQDKGQPTSGTRIRVDALGETGQENLQVQINGETVKNFRFTNQQSNELESFQFFVDDIVGIEDIRIRFTNDYFDSQTDRNLTVVSFQTIDVETGDREIARTTDSNVFARGVFTDADGIEPGFGRGDTLATNGFFEVRQQATRLRIDASGATGDEVMEVRLGDMVLGRFDVGQSKQAYFLNVDHNFDLSDLQIAFINDDSNDEGYDRNLTVFAYQKIDSDSQRTIVRQTQANVLSTGTFLDDDGLVAGFGRGNVLHANGFFQVSDSVHG
jgi:predicted GNAT family acetyltransferase